MNENLVAQIVNGAKAEKTSIPAELIRPNKYNFYEDEKFYKKIVMQKQAKTLN